MDGEFPNIRVVLVSFLIKKVVQTLGRTMVLDMDVSTSKATYDVEKGGNED